LLFWWLDWFCSKISSKRCFFSGPKIDHISWD
jgi:hypothetical protein